jgi:hypothetical protein
MRRLERGASFFNLHSALSLITFFGPAVVKALVNFAAIIYNGYISQYSGVREQNEEFEI